jgi:hypothetical protein
MRLLAALLILFMMPSIHAYGQTPQYRSVLIDEKGQLHILLNSGRQILPPKLNLQIAFSDPLLSRDHRTVGWFAEYPDPGAADPANRPYSGELVLYRSGHLLRSFSTEQTFWSWQFANRDRDVAYCTGPTHGGAAECELRSLTSGHLRARWIPDDKVDPPAWAKDLRF